MRAMMMPGKRGNNADGGPRAQRDNCNKEIRSIIDGGAGGGGSAIRRSRGTTDT